MKSLSAKSDNSPAVFELGINYYRKQDFPDICIYEFWRGGSPSAIDANREMAILTHYKNEKMFKLYYYPKGEEKPQFVENLPLDKLPEAVQNLKDAGF